eukprot:Pgem_evm1s1551
MVVYNDLQAIEYALSCISKQQKFNFSLLPIKFKKQFPNCNKFTTYHDLLYTLVCRQHQENTGFSEKNLIYKRKYMFACLLDAVKFAVDPRCYEKLFLLLISNRSESSEYGDDDVSFFKNELRKLVDKLNTVDVSAYTRKVVRTWPKRFIDGNEKTDSLNSSLVTTTTTTANIDLKPTTPIAATTTTTATSTSTTVKGTKTTPRRNGSKLFIHFLESLLVNPSDVENIAKEIAT